MNITIILKGIAMGIAEAIPGVSGGTIAFITGIYERLLLAIGKILGPEVIGELRKEGVAAAWRAADGGFILQLGIGMVGGLILAVVGITELLVHYPPVVWAFFFGLIISSAIYIGRQITQWGIGPIVLLVAGVIIAYFLTTINPMAGSSSLIFVFIAGAIAISALILPGISGSFILLLLGMYTVVFSAVRDLLGGELGKIQIVIVFGLGCLVGLALFSRLLTYTFKTFPNQTLAILTGFMVGSLNKLWPWRNPLSTRINSKGEEVPLLEIPVLPSQYTEGATFLPGVNVAFLVGMIIVLVLDYYTPDTKDNLEEAA
jgi:putative membrane protein